MGQRFDPELKAPTVRSFLPTFVALTFVALALPATAADMSPAEKNEFFEKQVRPLLVQHCHECHGAKKQEAGLRLDTHAGLLKGTDGGPVFLPENIDGSRLLQVLKYADNETQMPPKGKLSDEQIATVRKWLELAAPWPAEVASSDSAMAARQHWAFQPVRRSEIPASPQSPPGASGKFDDEISPPRSPIDSFIAAALAEKQLAISKPAARETFVRRVTLDLWGVPPTLDQVREFAGDTSPDACERLVDRLLVSPLYGQRWGRHWLDIARYADSKGYVFTAEPRYPYSYTYRDYVVNAFNADTPFDQFVVEQLAADVVVDNEQRNRGGTEYQDRRLAALGFLTVGRRYLNNNHDIIDDRIDVVSRGLLGLTVGCARCHDHKFDPIPTADYYSLYGIFSSTSEPDELPLIGAPRSPEAYRAFLVEIANLDAAVANYEHESVPKLMNEIREVAGDVLQLIAKESPVWANVPIALQGKSEPRPKLVQRWKDWLNRTVANPPPEFAPWHRLAKVAKAEDFSAEVGALIESWANGEDAENVNSLVRQAIIEQKPTTLLELARIYGGLVREVQNKWMAQQTSQPTVRQLPDTTMEELRKVLYGDGSPAQLTLEEARPAFGRDTREMITKLKRKAEQLRATSPEAPPRAMVVRDGPIHEPVIFVRGNPGRPGKPVPRQFLEVVSGSDRKPFTKGSGRLELAETIVSPGNPLTPRVIVNRIWQHHFGTGLVPTPSDFGTRGMPPSNPLLLDWLAAEMVGIEGTSTRTDSPRRWSLKRIHRLMLTSAVYRQSSTEDPVARGIDPENRLLWRMPRQRLDFEALRDSLLAVSGKIDDSLGGQPFDGVMNPATTRRTIYTFINRNDLPGIFRSFDFADTDTTAADRPQTTVPQQSLFAMNSPFIQEQARRLASDCRASPDDTHQIPLLYERVFSRSPTVDELRIGLDYLANAQTTAAEKLSPLERLAQVLLMTNEFVFVD